jgi:hypothetical protein
MGVLRVFQILAATVALSWAGLVAPALAQSIPYDISGLPPEMRIVVVEARAAQVQALRAAARAQDDGPGTIRFRGTNDDSYQGEGHMTSSEGPMRHGYGLLSWSDGEYYAGQHRTATGVGGNKYGYGVYVFASGHTYEGQFQDNRYNGYGVMWDASGQLLYAGRYQNGERVP